MALPRNCFTRDVREPGGVPGYLRSQDYPAPRPLRRPAGRQSGDEQVGVCSGTNRDARLSPRRGGQSDTQVPKQTFYFLKVDHVGRMTETIPIVQMSQFTKRGGGRMVAQTGGKFQRSLAHCAPVTLSPEALETFLIETCDEGPSLLAAGGSVKSPHYPGRPGSIAPQSNVDE
jgi:hypothetical protein